jgi:hypothetical protein
MQRSLRVYYCGSKITAKRTERMRRYKELWFCVTILLVYGVYSLYTRPIGTPVREGFSAENDPVQEEVDSDAGRPIVWERSGKGWRITPRANYRIAARVLHTERYRFGWQSSFSPVDLALGWGKISDPEVDNWIDWSQNMRWYFFHWSEGSPYTNDYIISHSANVHIVPSDDNLKRAVLKLHRNEIVLLEGDLVDIDTEKGEVTYWWHSSLSRQDTGDGSCELLWLKRLVFDGKEYR